MKYLRSHFTPTALDILHSHSVTKKRKDLGLCWYSVGTVSLVVLVVGGGLCRLCTLFLEQPHRGGSQGAKPGVLVLFPYKKPYYEGTWHSCLS